MYVVVLIALTVYESLAQAQAAPAQTMIVVDAKTPATSFPHFWEQMFGSGRAILALRESYRRDLRKVVDITGFRYVRFHAIFHDEVGVYDENNHGQPIYNFSYVDQIYDGLLAEGVRPFVELSFMPNKLAAQSVLHSFWYRPNISPPKDWGKWDGLITGFVSHLVARYGIDEVSGWYFEVWNEPNLDFWAGEPKQASYWELYDHTARAIKAVSPRLRVGGPATAQAAWVDDFIRHCMNSHVPVDFVSTHIYGDDPPLGVFGTNEAIPRDQMVCRAARKVRSQIQSSALPQLPLILSEFNATYRNDPDITDSIFMGPWLAETIQQCDGLVGMMSYWTFSDVFEEQGVVKTPFYGGYGLVAEDGIPKPAFNAFRLLHKLGSKRIAIDANSVMVTLTDARKLVLAVWNYSSPGEPGSPKTIPLKFENTSAQTARIWELGPDHGNVQPAYKNMGAPTYPTSAQIHELQAAAELPPPAISPLLDGTLTLTLAPHTLAVIEVE